MNLTDFANNLIIKEGVWTPTKDQNLISYPDDGNSVCYQVEDSSFWFKHRNACIESCLENFFPKSEIFFDIGGGNGFVAKQLQDKGVNVCLVEPGLEGIKNAKHRGVKNLIHATLESGSFLENNIAGLGAFDVVEHIEDDVAFVKDLHRFLKPGGKLFITVPAKQWLWSVNDDIAGHYRRYTIANMKRLLKSCGFTIDYISYLFRPLVLPLFLMRTIPSKVGLINTKNVREKTLKHHNQKNKEQVSFVDRLLFKEVEKVKARKQIGSGTSVLAVASK